MKQLLGIPLTHYFSISKVKNQIMNRAAVLLNYQWREVVLRLTSGDVVAVFCLSYPTFQDGEVSGAIVFIKDNREKKQLIHERELLGQAVDQSPVMIIIADDKSKIEYVNSGTIRWSGYSKNELLGNSFFSFVNPSAEGAITVKQLEQKLQNDQRWEGVIRTNSKWGSSVTVYCVISPVFDNDNMIVNTVAVCKEVSYEAALQDELLNAQKNGGSRTSVSKICPRVWQPSFWSKGCY